MDRESDIFKPSNHEYSIKIDGYSISNPRLIGNEIWIDIEPKWIKAENNTPPKDKDFLGFVLIGHHFESSLIDHRITGIKTCIWCKYRNNFIEYCNCSGYEHQRDFIEVTHWMPLPPPPNL